MQLSWNIPLVMMAVAERTYSDSPALLPKWRDSDSPSLKQIVDQSVAEIVKLKRLNE